MKSSESCASAAAPVHAASASASTTRRIPTSRVLPPGLGEELGPLQDLARLGALAGAAMLIKPVLLHGPRSHQRPALARNSGPCKISRGLAPWPGPPC